MPRVPSRETTVLSSPQAKAFEAPVVRRAGMAGLIAVPVQPPQFGRTKPRVPPFIPKRPFSQVLCDGPTRTARKGRKYAPGWSEKPRPNGCADANIAGGVAGT